MISEFEIALDELHEACTRSEINFHLEYAELLSESVINEGEDAKGKGVKALVDAIRNMVYSFSDFIKGALVTLCDKLKAVPELSRTGIDLAKKGEVAWAQVSNYWTDIKNTKGTDHGEGKLNTIKNKISDIIAKFRKVCKDVSFKLKTFADKMKARGAYETMNKGFKSANYKKAYKAGERVVDYADKFDRRMDERRADNRRAEEEKERRRVAKQKAKDMMDNIRRRSNQKLL